MRNRDLFLPSLTTLILCGLVWFLSCAHQNRNRQRLQEDSDFSQSEVAPTESESDFASSELENKEPETAKEAPLDERKVEDEFSLPSEKLAKQESAPEFVDESEFVETPEFPIIDKETSAAVPTTLPNNEDQELMKTIEEAPQPQLKTNWIGKAPPVPDASFMRNGTRLNRFYFVRKGDSPKKVSQLIYGTSTESKKLKSWNKANWTPGSILFYSSSQNPDDEEMQSFYQENQMPSEEYKVAKGDWLSSIARKKLGDFRSWKEIAWVNNLEAPNSLEEGQVLTLYSKNLGAPSSDKPKSNLVQSVPAKSIAPLKEEPELARALEEAVPIPPEPQVQAQVQPLPMPEPPVQAQQVQPLPMPEPPVQAQQVQPLPMPEPPAQVQAQPTLNPKGETASGSAEVNWDQLIEQNFVAILIGAALIILLLALSARKKRLKAKSSNDEETGSEPKTRLGRR